MRLFTKIDLLLKNISNTLLLVLSLAIIISTIAVAIVLIPTKILAIVISSIGSILGALILSYTLNRVKEITKKDDEKNIKEKVLLEQKLQEYEKIELDLQNAQSEIDSLKSMKLNISAVSKILELGVAEAEMTSTHYKHKVLKRADSKIGRDEETEYLGILEYNYTAKLGVNLQNVRIRNINNDTIEVSGIKTENLGFKEQNAPDWKIREIRTKKTNSVFASDETIINIKDERLQELCDTQDKEVKAQINNGFELNNFNVYVTRYAQDFISLLLSPLNKYRINFVEEQNLNGKTIESYFFEHNNRIAEKIAKLEDSRRMKLLTFKKPINANQ